MGWRDRRRLSKSYNIEDLRHVARRRIPSLIFDFAYGAAEDEVAALRSTASFANYTLMPQPLVDVSEIDMSTTVLGTKIKFPMIVAPSGMSCLFNHEGEKALSRAAGKFGIPYTLFRSVRQYRGHCQGREWREVVPDLCVEG